LVFDAIFGQVGFEMREGGVASGVKVGLGSLVGGVAFPFWIIANEELGLGGKPSEINFGITMK